MSRNEIKDDFVLWPIPAAILDAILNSDQRKRVGTSHPGKIQSRGRILLKKAIIALRGECAS